MATVTTHDLSTQIEQAKADLEKLRTQLAQLEGRSPGGDLIEEIQHQTAVRRGRILIAEREAMLTELEAQLAAEKADAARQEQIASVVRKLAAAVKKWNHLSGEAAAVLADIQSLAAEHIAHGEGAAIAGITSLSVGRPIVENPSGRGYRVGS